MSYCCSQCDFTAQFESALTMHRQLHHCAIGSVDWDKKILSIAHEKSKTVPSAACQERSFNNSEERFISKLGRTNSATRLFGKLRARICRSKTLFAHPEEGVDHINDLPSPNDSSSKTLKNKTPSCGQRRNSIMDVNQESYACHLCSFDADRITVLDRHLLTHHKIGLENLLKLVMAKTKDGLTDERDSTIYGVRTPYYKSPDDIIDEGEFIIETVTPKIKILKHAGVNTDLKGRDIDELKRDLIEDEVDKLTELNVDNDKRELLEKMNTINECMCKFVDSSNMLKKVLVKEFDQKNNRNERTDDSIGFELGLGDQGKETPRNWERAHSERLERSRSKYGESRSNSEKLKNTSESFYF